ncbi:MAG: MarR family winged helix-turn-helix transcriptional regulator [Methanomassiliicoccales archaeon]
MENNLTIREIALHASNTCTVFNMRKASRLVGQFYDQAFSSLGIRTTQFSLLLAIAYQEPATINHLAQIMGMDRTTLSRNVRVLAKNNLVTLTKGEDRREQLINLTNQGADLIQQALPIWETTQDKFGQLFGKEWTQRLIANFHEIYRHLG